MTIITNAAHPALIPLIIDNASVETATRFDVTNPKSGQVIYQCSSASVEEANRAVEAAQAAFHVWSNLKPTDRTELLWKAADIMLSRKEELVRYQEEETGSGGAFAASTVMMGVNFLRLFAGRISSIEGTVPTVAQEGQSAVVVKEPYGVILGIAPWNAPFILGIRAVALPLAAGNTTILKGSELSPKCFWAIGDIFRQAGFPKGCVNILYHQLSDAERVTTALIAHPVVKKVTFTGSTRTGSIIASTAGKYIKPLLLELGGKASCIVLDDADLNKAAMGCALGSFLHSGQVCMSTERIIVQRSIAESFRKVLVDTTEKVFGTNAPPTFLVTPASIEKNKKLISDAVFKGASVLFGDPNTHEPRPTSMRPLIVENVTKEMDLYRTESFGPTVSLYIVDSEEEAITLANDTEYGLSAAVYTEELRRGLRVARRIESGAVHINSMTIHDEPVLPHGGYKTSGFGRFGGSVGFDEFLQTKTITWLD